MKSAALVSSALATLVVTSPVAAAGDGMPELVRVYKTQPIPLRLDPSRIAVSMPGDGDGQLARATLMALEPQIGEPEERGIPGSWLAAVPARIDTPEQSRALVAQLAAAGPLFVSPVLLDERGNPMTVTPDILVRFRAEASDQERLDILERFVPQGRILAADWAGMAGVFRVRSGSSDGFVVLDQANELARHALTRWAEVDWQMPVYHEEIPTDPQFDDCWQHLNTGQDGSGSCLGWTNPDGIPGMDMDSTEAWDITTGDASVVVAVFDTGIDQDHPDINQLPGYDFVNEGGDGGPWNSCDSHGTFVAGTISAIMNNGIGVVGVAPDCPVVSMKVFNSGGVGCTGAALQASYIVDGLDLAVELGVRVTNHSYGTGASEAVEDMFTKTAAGGMVHFASAGNGGDDMIGDADILFPASVPTVNAVAALESDASLSPYSNYGAPGTTWPEAESLFISAPGSSICSTTPGGSGLFCGTSAASPCAAGVAALVLSVHPDASAFNVEQYMAWGAVDLGSAGYDETYGYGFVNARGAVLAALDALYGDDCGSGTGTCFDPNGSAGCEFVTCCFIVCSADPFCCETQWDSMCADEAVDLCLGCGQGGSCFQQHAQPGCSDGDCCAQVCEIDPQCCSSQWDGACVALAETLCAEQAANDDCADATVVDDGTHVYNTTFATPDGPTHLACGLFAAFNRDVWFDYTPACTGILTASVVGTGQNPKIAVYAGCACPVNNISLLGCDSGDADMAEVSGVFVEAGDCYKVRVATANPTSGVGLVTLDCRPSFDSCDSALLLQGAAEYTLNFNTIGADTDGPTHSGCGTISNDIWYDVRATCNGNLVVSTCGTADFDTKIAIYDGLGCPVTGSNLISCSDDHPTCPGETTLAAAPVVANQWYKVRLGGHGEEGTGTVHILCSPGPANDYCENAALTFLGIPTPFDNVGATTDGPETTFCGLTGNQVFHDVWFRRPATCTGEMTVSTCSANFRTKVAVYEGVDCPVTNDRLLGCSGTGCTPIPLRGSVTVDVVEGQLYLIRVGSLSADTGHGDLEIECVPEPECPGDINGDDVTNVDDLVAVILAWGPCDGCPQDIDGNGTVDVDDLVAVVLGWGSCPD